MEPDDGDRGIAGLTRYPPIPIWRQKRRAPLTLRRVPLPPALLAEVRARIGKLVPFSSPGQFNARVRVLSRVSRFHVPQLRHTFACRWLEAGGSLPALQQCSVTARS